MCSYRRSWQLYRMDLTGFVRASMEVLEGLAGRVVRVGGFWGCAFNLKPNGFGIAAARVPNSQHRQGSMLPDAGNNDSNSPSTDQRAQPFPYCHMFFKHLEPCKDHC